jgi:NitT/TauT family transport system substrate-binding protein
MTVKQTGSRRILSAAFALALAWAPFVASPAQATEKVDFSWLPSTDSLPFFVALEDKLFEAQGIEPVPHKFGTPALVVDSFVSGRSDVGASGTAAGIALIAESRFPGTMRVFGFTGGELDPPMINNDLVALKTSPIKSFADLKGHKLGTVPGIQWRTISRYILRQSGLDPDKDVQVIELGLPLQVQAVMSGTVDALLSFEPMTSMAVATGNVRVVMEDPAQRFIGNPFWGGASTMTVKFVKERPAVAAKIIAVMDIAMKRAQDNFDHYKPLLAKYAGVPDSSLPFVRPILFRSDSQIGPGDVAAFQKFADVLFKEGVMPRAVDAQALIIRPSDLK